MEQLVQQIGLPIVALLVPLVVQLLKTKVMPSIPVWLIPILALVLGPLGEFAVAKLTATTMTGWSGALAGLAGVGVREIVDQLRKALAPPA
jgi:hypothetical protein